MLKITFANTHEYPYETATAIAREYIASEMRDSLEIVFPTSVGISDILSEAVSENLDEITLTNDELEIVNTISGHTYVNFVGVKDGKVVLKICTGNVDEQIINIITRGVITNDY